jgi:hypothetical protein
MGRSRISNSGPGLGAQTGATFRERTSAMAKGKDKGNKGKSKTKGKAKDNKGKLKDKKLAVKEG